MAVVGLTFAAELRGVVQGMPEPAALIIADSPAILQRGRLPDRHLPRHAHSISLPDGRQRRANLGRLLSTDTGRSQAELNR